MTVPYHADTVYLDLCKHVLENGVLKEDRTGTGTLSTFGYQMRFDLAKGFPLLTTKKVAWKSMVRELLWFLRGETNIEPLNAYGVTIWDEWADANGNLGPIYGAQWRSWSVPYEDFDYDGEGEIYEFVSTQTIDQIADVIEQIKTNPDSRRLIVSSWNVGELDEMALPPCHLLFQFYVANGKLSCQLYQRSADIFLGVPFNIASYALLTHIIAKICGLEVGEFVHTIGDAHIYTNHVEQIREQLERSPREMPMVEISEEVKDIDSVYFEDITLIGYDPHPAIHGKVAV